MQAISSTVHPTGQVLAIGSVNGIISIIACASGEILQHLEISSVCIGCMSYSADGSFLVAGCQDGNLHVLPANDNGYSYSKVSVLKVFIRLPLTVLFWLILLCPRFRVLYPYWPCNGQWTPSSFLLRWMIVSDGLVHSTVLRYWNDSLPIDNYQELILCKFHHSSSVKLTCHSKGDLHNTRYIRNVTNFSDNLRWYNATCSGLEDARGTILMLLSFATLAKPTL